MKKYDVIVIGGGPGGYIAAEHVAKQGHSVAIIEKSDLGGTCLNRGCIPSKTLLRHSEVIELIKKAEDWGIEVENIQFSFEKMMRRKNKVVSGLKKGVEALLKNAKVDIYEGFGTVYPNLHILISHSNNDETIIYGDKIILATGSSPKLPPITGLSQTNYYTSDNIFDIEEIPDSIIIVGGGIIGIEFACIFSSLNSKVTIIETEPRLIPEVDKDAASLIMKKLTKENNVKIIDSSLVTNIESDKNKKVLMVRDNKGVEQLIEADEILVATGRQPNLEGIKELCLSMNGPYVAVNNQMETNLPNIYAIGDLIGGEQLAHVASEEGIVAANNAINNYKVINYQVIPHCIYTTPEIATVGLSEMEATDKGIDVRTEIFPLTRLGKAVAMDETEGFIKIIATEKYNELLGVVIVAPHATEMISEAATILAFEGTINELVDIIHPHPTLSEGLSDAARLWLEKQKVLIN